MKQRVRILLSSHSDFFYPENQCLTYVYITFNMIETNSGQHKLTSDVLLHKRWFVLPQRPILLHSQISLNIRSNLQLEQLLKQRLLSSRHPRTSVVIPI